MYEFSVRTALVQLIWPLPEFTYIKWSGYPFSWSHGQLCCHHEPLILLSAVRRFDEPWRILTKQNSCHRSCRFGPFKYRISLKLIYWIHHYSHPIYQKRIVGEIITSTLWSGRGIYPDGLPTPSRNWYNLHKLHSVVCLLFGVKMYKNRVELTSVALFYLSFLVVFLLSQSEQFRQFPLPV